MAAVMMRLTSHSLARALCSSVVIWRMKVQLVFSSGTCSRRKFENNPVLRGSGLSTSEDKVDDVQVGRQGCHT